MRAMSSFQPGFQISVMRAAKELGVQTTGYIAKWYAVYDGEHPDYAAEYRAIECNQLDWASVLQKNIEASDGTFLGYNDPFMQFNVSVVNRCKDSGKSCFTLNIPLFLKLSGDEKSKSIDDFSAWIHKNSVNSVNFAGGINIGTNVEVDEKIGLIVAKAFVRRMVENNG